MIKLLLLSWGVVHSNLGLAHADSRLLRSRQHLYGICISYHSGLQGTEPPVS